MLVVEDVLQSCVDLDLCFDYELKVSWLSEASSVVYEFPDHEAMILQK